MDAINNYRRQRLSAPARSAFYVDLFVCSYSGRHLSLPPPSSPRVFARHTQRHHSASCHPANRVNAAQVPHREQGGVTPAVTLSPPESLLPSTVAMPDTPLHSTNNHVSSLPVGTGTPPERPKTESNSGSTQEPIAGYTTGTARCLFAYINIIVSIMPVRISLWMY